MHDPLMLLDGLQQLLGNPDIRVRHAQVPFQVRDVDRSAAFLRERARARASTRGGAQGVIRLVRQGIQEFRQRGLNVRGEESGYLERIPDDDGPRENVSTEGCEFAECDGWAVGACIFRGGEGSAPCLNAR